MRHQFDPDEKGDDAWCLFAGGFLFGVCTAAVILLPIMMF